MKSMKNHFLALGFTLAGFASLAQTGVHIEYKLSSDKNMTGSIVQYSQDGNSRSETKISVPAMPGGSISSIILKQKEKPGTLYKLNVTAKTYTETTLLPQDKPKDEAQDCQVKVIGKEKVGNYNCTHVSVTQGKTNYEMWTTTDIADFTKYRTSNQKYLGNDKVYQTLKANNADGFLVKVLHKAEGGREGTVTVELVTLEKKTLPADLFQVPADYKKSDASASYGPGNMPSAAEIQNMTPEERNKLVRQLQQQNQQNHATLKPAGNQ